MIASYGDWVFKRKGVRVRREIEGIAGEKKKVEKGSLERKVKLSYIDVGRCAH